ncbi:dihydrofolate reductase [Geobacter sp. SVR]|uniref:dihydrofolate reductase n=1 Tax=Geobacter sp. SVR TaxID=2495594 RepID=UPI00143EF909|nr:dihydrofolate reductase [Geobacter sp. SVR]BCS54643.1 dihydrofolate reductase [Geobacter sp. SVR]GCF86849.1 dihydrofolate reductase [Geobacter sp. SVR]
MTDQDMPIRIIAAMTGEGVIGAGNKLPWHIPAELQLFRQLTLGGTVIMGRRTFQSIGRPLPGRHNIVLSSTVPVLEGAQTARSFGEALDKGRQAQRPIFIIGGVQLFREALPIADGMYISLIHHPYPGDVYFPPFDQERWRLEKEQPFEQFTLRSYVRIR